VAEEGTAMEKTLCGCLATRPLAVSIQSVIARFSVHIVALMLVSFQCLPEPKGAMLGKLGHFLQKSGTDEVWDKVANEAARTVPGRENGGNCDIKNLSRGCAV